jgi:hypothetical protein
MAHVLARKAATCGTYVDPMAAHRLDRRGTPASCVRAWAAGGNERHEGGTDAHECAGPWRPCDERISQMRQVVPAVRERLSRMRRGRGAQA